MARPLTKRKKDGTLYTRPPDVEAHIDRSISLTESELRTRLLITDPLDPRYVLSECLVYLIREGVREHRYSRGQGHINLVLPVLLGRCEQVLRVKVQGRWIPDAEILCEEILRTFSALLAEDGPNGSTEKLDIYECRFHRAFRAFWIDAVRREQRRHEVPLPEETGEPDADGDTFVGIPEQLHFWPTEDDDVLRERLYHAIQSLPPDQRNAVVLVYGLGYKIESDDRLEETAAIRCKCSGRTIRNRLARAIKTLRRLLDAQSENQDEDEES